MLTTVRLTIRDTAGNLITVGRCHPIEANLLCEKKVAEWQGETLVLNVIPKVPQGFAPVGRDIHCRAPVEWFQAVAYHRLGGNTMFVADSPRQRYLGFVVEETGDTYYLSLSALKAMTEKDTEPMQQFGFTHSMVREALGTAGGRNYILDCHDGFYSDQVPLPSLSEEETDLLLQGKPVGILEEALFHLLQKSTQTEEEPPPQEKEVVSNEQWLVECGNPSGWRPLDVDLYHHEMSIFGLDALDTLILLDLGSAICTDFEGKLLIFSSDLTLGQAQRNSEGKWVYKIKERLLLNQSGFHSPSWTLKRLLWRQGLLDETPISKPIESRGTRFSYPEDRNIIPLVTKDGEPVVAVFQGWFVRSGNKLHVTLDSGVRFTAEMTQWFLSELEDDSRVSGYVVPKEFQTT